MSELVSSETIAPGESGQIKITLDPAGKFGPITKSVKIKSNNLTQPTATVWLYATVVHGVDPESSESIEEILFGRAECAECHAERAADLVGVDLYEAICEMCHGPLPEYAAALSFEPLKPQELRSWIADGRGDLGMPGYSADMGGPLSNGQIDSLVEELQSAYGDSE